MNKQNARHELILKIKVEPRSSKSGIAGTYGDALKVKLTSPPVEGKANRELVDLLAREFGIKKRDVKIVSGKSAKHKVVRLTGVRNIEKILNRNFPA